MGHDVAVNNRPLLRDLFPQMFAAPAVSTAAAVPMNITLTPLKDEEYRLRLTKAGWKGGIPQEFIDPQFKTIIDNDRFKQWLAFVELKVIPIVISAWQNPEELKRAVESCRLGEEYLQAQMLAQAVVPTPPVDIANAAVLGASVEAELDKDLALLNRAQASSSTAGDACCGHTMKSCTCSSSFTFSSHLSSSGFSFLSSRASSPAIAGDSVWDFSVNSSDFIDNNGLFK